MKCPHCQSGDLGYERHQFFSWVTWWRCPICGYREFTKYKEPKSKPIPKKKPGRPQRIYKLK